MVRQHLFLLCAGLLWLGAVIGSPLADHETIVAKRATGGKIVQEIKMYNSKGVLKTASVEEACLKAHNKVRALHKWTPALTYDAQLASEAADWALHLTQLGYSDHSDGDYGENLYSSAAGDGLFGGELTAASPAHAVYSWYSESWQVNENPQTYNYGSESNPGTGHFTQVVWKSTTKVGCGVAVVSDGGFMKTYIVVRYKDAGNMAGAYVKNVKPMKADAQPPLGPGDLDTITSCVNYGQNCGMYQSSCAYIKEFCDCTCG